MCKSAAVKKIEAIGCLVSKLQSEMHRRRGTQLFEKAHGNTVNLMFWILLCCIKMTYSCKKKAWKHFTLQLGNQATNCFNFFTAALLHINVSTFSRSLIFFCILSCCIKLTCSCKKTAWKSARQLGKTAVVKVGAYSVHVDRKTTIYRLQACEIALFEKCVYQAFHSNAFPLTCLWVQAYSAFVVAKPGFITQYSTVHAPWCNNLSIAGKWPVWIKLEFNFCRMCRFLLSGPHNNYIYKSMYVKTWHHFSI